MPELENKNNAPDRFFTPFFDALKSIGSNVDLHQDLEQNNRVSFASKIKGAFTSLINSIDNQPLNSSKAKIMRDMLLMLSKISGVLDNKIDTDFPELKNKEFNLNNTNLENIEKLKKFLKLVLGNSTLQNDLIEELWNQCLKKKNDDTDDKQRKFSKHFESKVLSSVDAMSGQALYDPLVRMGILLAELYDMMEQRSNPYRDVLEGNEDDPAKNAYRNYMRKRFGGDQAMQAAPPIAPPINLNNNRI